MNSETRRIMRRKYADARAAGIPARPTGRRPRFTEDEVRALVESLRAGRSIESLAREHRTSQSVIARYVRYGFVPARWRA